MPLDIFDRPIALQRGDIVSCRFPLAEAPERPGPKARPCLVLDVGRASDGALVAEVAYGTDEANTSNSGLDFSISSPEDRAAASLDKPTRMVLARTAVVPVSRRFLSVNGSGTAVLGRLPDRFWPLFERLDARRLAIRGTTAAQARLTARPRGAACGRVPPIMRPGAR